MRYVSVFLFGILSAGFALLLELLLIGFGIVSESSLNNLLSGMTKATTTLSPLILFASAEEIARFLFVRQYARRFPFTEETKKTSLLLLGILFGAGFSSLEIILGLQDLPTDARSGLFGVLAVHAFFSVLFFFYFFSRKEKSLWKNVSILSLAVSLHTLYNFLVLRMTA